MRHSVVEWTASYNPHKSKSIGQKWYAILSYKAMRCTVMCSIDVYGTRLVNPLHCQQCNVIKLRCTVHILQQFRFHSFDKFMGGVIAAL